MKKQYSDNGSKQLAHANFLGRFASAVMSGLVALPILAGADEAKSNGDSSASKKAESTAETKAEKGAPLPLHQIEGNGGIFSTLSAYLVNPARNGEWVGRPSVGFGYVNLGHGRNLEALSITETIGKRLELGYGWDNLDLGDLGQDIQNATKIKIGEDAVHLHNFNARLQVLHENDFDQKWLPAFTVGLHYKYNDAIDSINRDLKGTLRGIGIKGGDGVDITGYFSKLFTFLPRPVLINLGVRGTEAAHLGLLGFTDGYEAVFEGNIVVFLTDAFALAAEFKQKPNNYKRIANLLESEDHWWTIDAAYVVNKHLTFAAGYGHFGEVLNHEANGVWGLTTKWEF